VSRRWSAPGDFCGGATKTKYACSGTTKQQEMWYTRTCTGSSGTCGGSYGWEVYLVKPCSSGYTCKSDVGKCIKKNPYACSQKSYWASKHNSGSSLCKKKSEVASGCTGYKYTTNCAWCSAVASALCSGNTAQSTIEAHLKKLKSCKAPCTKVYNF
jgi:hypothetical protein